MSRPQLTIAWVMIAIAVIGYFCAFPELAVLLGIFLLSMLFLSPVVLLMYVACRASLKGSAGAPPALPGGAEAVADARARTETEPNAGEGQVGESSETHRGGRLP